MTRSRPPSWLQWLHPPEDWKKGVRSPNHHSTHHLCGSSKAFSHDADTHPKSCRVDKDLGACIACTEEALPLGWPWGHRASSTAPMVERKWGGDSEKDSHSPHRLPMC